MSLLKQNKENKPSSDQAFKNPKILEVDLIKQEISLEFNWKKNLFSLFFIFGTFIIILIELYFGLNWWQKDEEQRLEAIKAESELLRADINQSREDARAALTYQDKTEVITPLLDNHIYWSNFFSWLEKNTLSTVKYTNLDLKLNSDFAFSAHANSFAEVSWQVKQFLDDPFVKDVEVATASANGHALTQEQLAQLASEGASLADLNLASRAPEVSFSIEFSLDQDIFKK